MKKLFLALTASLALGSFMPAMAENQSYIFLDEDDNCMSGILRRVSPNGKWAAGCDEDNEQGSWLVNTADPENYEFTPEGLMLDVDDNGLVVGAYFDVINGLKYKRAAIYYKSEWKRLPLPEEILGASYAVAISADSKTIAGHGLCSSDIPDEPGKYFPIVWKLNESTGEYELYKLYNNLSLPGTYGFFIQDMTPDAKIVCGSQSLNMGDQIAAMFNLETEEYTIWHEILEGEYSWVYQGVTYVSEGMFVDGILDGFDDVMEFGGRLNYATNDYIFGSRAQVYEVKDDGSGFIVNYSTVYDIKNDVFFDGESDYFYTCGKTPQQVFTSTGFAIDNGDETYLNSSALNTWDGIDVVYSIDDSGRILTGSHVAQYGWGEYYESPVLIVLDSPIFAGIDNIKADASLAKVGVMGNTITIDNASQVEIFNSAGVLVSTASKVSVPAGIYLVVADGKLHKVAVK